MKLLSTGKCDIQALKTQVQQNNTQQLHRITTSLWDCAPIWPSRTAARPRTYSSRSSSSRLIYPWPEAARLLAELPAKAEG